MKKRKHGTIGSYPEINMGGPSNATKECIDLEDTGASIIKSEAKASLGIITEESQIEDKIGEKAKTRLDFFNNFFSADNMMPLGRVMVYGTEYPRRYTIVRFGGGDFFKDWSYHEPRCAPISIKNPSKNLEEYLRYLYTHMTEEVEYIEGITDEEFQAFIKALFIDKKLVISEFEKIDDPIYDIGKKEKVICLTDKKNALYWLRDDVIPVIDPDYLRVLDRRYSSFMEGSVNVSDLKSLYMYFRENGHPNMKVLKLEDASDNPFKFLR